jgi:hypothetical protein
MFLAGNRGKGFEQFGNEISKFAVSDYFRYIALHYATAQRARVYKCDCKGCMATIDTLTGYAQPSSDYIREHGWTISWFKV